MNKKILLVDNYDSFVYNIARYITQLGGETRVVRNDVITLNDVIEYHPSHIVFSPGPGTPIDAGITLTLIKQCYTHYPMLGICLGHQAIGQVFGAEIKRALKPRHGLATQISHDATRLFHGISTPINVGLYHSLIVDENMLSKDMLVTARSLDGEVMAISHRTLPLHGVQFHPESILTMCGYAILNNFLQESL